MDAGSYSSKFAYMKDRAVEKGDITTKKPCIFVTPIVLYSSILYTTRARNNITNLLEIALN